MDLESGYGTASRHGAKRGQVGCVRISSLGRFLPLISALEFCSLSCSFWFLQPPNMAALSEIHAEPLGPKLPTVWERFTDCVERYPDNIAVVCTHQAPELYGIPNVPLQHEVYQKKPYLRWTYTSFRGAIDRFAHGLEAQGARSGMALIMFMPNVIEFMIARWETIQNAMVDVPINPRNLSNREEAIHMLKTAILSTSERVVLLANDEDTANHLDNLGIIGPGSIRIVVSGKPASGDWISFESLMKKGIDHALNGATQNRHIQNPCATRLLVTSGTTSLPKGCRSVPDDLSYMFGQLGALPGDWHPSTVPNLVVPNNHAMNYICDMWAHGKGGAVVMPGANILSTRQHSFKLAM